MIAPPPSHLKHIDKLNLPLTSLKGIGPKRGALLARRGLQSILDLLFLLPNRYQDRSRIVSVGELRVGCYGLTVAKAVLCLEEKFYRSGKRLLKIVVTDETGSLELLWFQYKRPHLMKFARRGLKLMVYGRVQEQGGRKQMIHPDVVSFDTENSLFNLGFFPIYPAIDGLSGQVLRSAIREALSQSGDSLTDLIPPEITRRLGLPRLDVAVRSLHVVPDGTSLRELNNLRTSYHRRVAFERFFQIMLNVSLRRRVRESRSGPMLPVPVNLKSTLEGCFPFSLTHDQDMVIAEILGDLRSGKAMNRLVQGDVGCGKTVVAAVAAHVTVLSGYQVALMAPTQVLARQHYDYFSSLSGKLGFRPVLLTGQTKGREKPLARGQIRNGRSNLIVGTHALIQDSLAFANLGLVVIDEQHRFGVRQRVSLDKKGGNPHLLVMTATPIPRTLAMTVFADLDISTIREYPKGRQAVQTHLVGPEKKRVVFQAVRERMAAGQQVMVICPLIEGTEDTDLKAALEMADKLRKVYDPPFKIGLIHGRMSPENKDRAMEHFRTGRTDLLVGTTVIEVGVHVPRASVMVIEDPERFGLAQLHQLRGRVGRGNERGLCFLMVGKGLPQQGLSRLKFLARTHDGFHIAEKDLELRGHGELMGMRQTGSGELDLAEMVREPELLMAAKREAEALIEKDPDLSFPENRYLRLMIDSAWPEPLEY